jgi:diaminopropionate ammonia-lyase
LIQQRVRRETGLVPSSADLRLGAHAAVAAELTVTTATDGNHGRAVAWGAAEFGCRSVIYVPRACSRVREHAISSFGAEVVRTTLDYDDTVRQCAADAARNGWQVVSDTSWEGYEEIPATIMAGYTVMVFEAAEQLGPPPTHVFVQGGVGGLAAAVCAHYWLRCGAMRPRFIVVEPEGAACLMSSARAGRPTRPEGEIHTIMACLECGEASPLAWQMLDKGANFFMTIPDSAAPKTMRLLAKSGIIAGESGVAGLAGLLAAVQNPQAREQLALTKDSRVLVFGTEGATDPVAWRKLVSELATGH